MAPERNQSKFSGQTRALDQRVKSPTNNLSPSSSCLSNEETNSNSNNNNQQQQQTKRILPSKAQVGLAKAPDLKNCKSKIGSLQNIKHIPAGGSVTIQNNKLDWKAKSKVGSLDNREHKPGGGKLVVETKKLEWKTSPKVQSLANINHKPGGGKVKIFNEVYNKPNKCSGINSSLKARSSSPSNKD